MLPDQHLQLIVVLLQFAYRYLSRHAYFLLYWPGDSTSGSLVGEHGNTHHGFNVRIDNGFRSVRAKVCNRCAWG